MRKKLDQPHKSRDTQGRRAVACREKKDAVRAAENEDRENIPPEIT